MSRFMACVVAILSAVSTGQGQVQPVLKVAFDQDCDGEGPAGRIKATLVGQPVRVPGKVGQALKAGPTFGHVEYPTEGIVNPSGGTVEMWVCPVDWTPDDGKFHVFFEARGQGALYLYEYWEGSRLLMLTCEDVGGPYASSPLSTGGWQPGQWHHVAGTWSAQGVRCYIDGKPAGSAPVPGRLPKALGKTFQIGDRPWQFPRSTATLVDEVRIYDRALSPDHIAAHFAGRFDFTKPLAAHTCTLDYRIDPQTGRVDVCLDTAGADVDDARLSARVAIVNKGAELLAEAPPLRFQAGQAAGTLALGQRQPGEYRLLARIAVDGRPTLEVERPLVVPAAEWLGNKLGLDDKVLLPWTPMELHDDRVLCWGRQYRLGRSPLPVQITSAGQDLLAQGLIVRWEHGAQAAAWQGGSCQAVLSPARTRVEATGLLQGTLGDQPVTLHVRTTIEYDGLALVELTLPPEGRPDVDRLTLEIPVQAAHALYQHRYRAGWDDLTGHLPAREGTVDQTAFVPYYWLGDNDRGLFWMCESDQMWPNGEQADAVEVVRRPGQAVLRLNILAPGQKLPREWKFVFGLQATPVKPLPKDWRRWRVAPARQANVEILWPVPGRRDSLAQFGFPEAADPAAFTARIRDVHAQGRRAVPYLCLTWITDDTPEWRYFHQAWAAGPVDGSIPAGGWKHQFPMVSPVGLGFSDYLAWKIHGFLRQYGIDGQYHDQTHPYKANNVRCGVGYVRDGRERYVYPILGYRALYRRIYAIQKELFPDSFTMAHMSGKVTIPILAYDDSYLDGEHFRGKVKDCYLDVLRLDTFRAEFMGRQWGLMPFFLPEFDAEHARQVEPTRGLMGLLMIHDVSVWPIWCNAAVANEALDALDAFGHVDAEFIGYFDPRPPATTDLADVYASAYRRADGRTLLVIANLGREDRRGTVRIDGGRLGLGSGRWVTWPQRQPADVVDGALRLDVPRLGYRMVVFEKE